jgi:AraC-like DNA-binding protein
MIGTAEPTSRTKEDGALLKDQPMGDTDCVHDHLASTLTKPMDLLISTTTPRPMNVRRWKSCVELRPFVEAFCIREAHLGSRQAYVPLPARRDCFLEFYLQGRYRVVTVANGAEHWAPGCVLVGPSTQRREDLKLSGTLQVFSIRFSPTGFHALFGIPARLLRDQAAEAQAVLGPEIRELHEQFAAAGPAQWQTIAERYLLKRLRILSVSAESLIAGEAAARMRASRGNLGVAEVAARSAVSPRHLERAFQEQIGVSPKMFNKLLRLDHALEQVNQRKSWAEIATLCGYFDQSHMARDFRAMAGATPKAFEALRNAQTLS